MMLILQVLNRVDITHSKQMPSIQRAAKYTDEENRKQPGI